MNPYSTRLSAILIVCCLSPSRADELPKLPTLKQIAAAAPSLPEALHVATIPGEFSNLLDSIHGIPETVNDDFHWRRNYDDPIKFMLISAADSDADPALKQRAIKRLRTMFALHRRKDIPQLTAGGKFINADKPDGPYFEHSLIDYIIPYVALYDTSERAQSVMHNYCRWVIRDQKNGTKGHRQQPNDPTFYSRAWMRRVWLLIAFGDAVGVPEDLRKELHCLAKAEMEWITSNQADGTIDSVGWATDLNVIYMHQSASTEHQGRVVHVYFQEVLNDILIRVVNTRFYDKNKSLVDKWIKQTKTTSETLVSTSGPFPNARKQTLTSYRGDQWFLDKRDEKSHKVNPTGADWAPAMLWLSIENKSMAENLVRECSGEWLPNFRWNVSHVICNSLIVEKEKRRSRR